jgi:hypothetical protein
VKPRTARQRAQTTPESAKAVRCAIYTRKSTEEGLDQPFNSLNAQREAAEAYIARAKDISRCLRARGPAGYFDR